VSRAGAPDPSGDARLAARWTASYHPLVGPSWEERQGLLRELLGRVGEDVRVRPPFHCDYGYNIELGDGVFINFNCVILDVNPVRIGAGTQIGPGVQILAADHPRDAALRRQGLESGKPVRI